MDRNTKEFWFGVFALVSITVGAGVLTLPYIFIKAGFANSVIILIFMTVILMILYLYLAEVVLRTKGKHQLTGLAEKYLGKYGKTSMFIFSSIGIYGALLAYIIGAGKALNAIYFWNETYYSIIYFLIMSTILYYGKNVFIRVESIVSLIKLLFVVILGVILIPKFTITQVNGFNVEYFYLPYGVFMFSLLAVSSIPIMNEHIKSKQTLKKSIIWGMIITAVVYLIFVVGMIGAGATNELSTTSLGGKVGLLANCFALFGISTAFIGLAYIQKEVFMYDYLISKFNAWILTIILPILLYLIDLDGFIRIIEVTGSVSGGLMLLLVLIIHTKAKKLGNRTPELNYKENILFKVLLGILFIVGIVLLFI
ncbi:hypothetical protein J4476_05125 [Candidatus Woesearchaeota archaeon]|nr:MAG: aromatic amino acid permease [archaeon GW2011_AR18]MBS3162046.1 hypothetical protein [Candidatus Woesearchaeota archaeon]HIH25915.1 hypothetical protein [Nanoarchaeota archaeon]